MAKLYIFTDRGRNEYNLTDHNVLGRHPKNRIKVTAPGVSKVHCLIVAEGAKAFSIRDLGSRNGTFVNDKRVKGKIVLRDGYDIRMGKIRCLFRDQHDAQVINWIEEAPAAIRKCILKKVAPRKLNKFFPQNNIIDDEMLRADYERLRISFALQRDIGFDLHVDFIMACVLDRLFEFIDFDWGVILLIDALGHFNVHSLKLKKPDTVVHLSRNLIDCVVQEGLGMLLADPRPEDGRPPSDLLDTPVRSSLAVPIMDEQASMGTILIAKENTYTPFQERDLNLISNAANKAATFIRNSRIAKSIIRESLEHERFRKIVSPEMAELVVNGQLQVVEYGEWRPATLLMANIIGFREMAREMAPDLLVAMLNHHFESLVGVVFRHQGMVDGFRGDRLLAAWGVPLAHDDDARRAVTAALEMLQKVENLNAKRDAADEYLLEIGIGLASGKVLVASMGSARTKRYSILGDPALRAAAVCSAAKAGQLVIDVETHQAVRGSLAAEECQAVECQEGVVRCFEVLRGTDGRPWSYLG